MLSHSKNSESNNSICLILDSQDLPIPIDKSYSIITENIEGFKNSPGSSITTWITIDPKSSKEDLRDFAKFEEIKGFRLSSSKYTDISEAKQHIGTIERLFSKNFKICFDISGPKIRTTKIKEISNKNFIEIYKDEKAILINHDHLSKKNLERFYNLKIIPFLGHLEFISKNSMILISDGWNQFIVEDIFECGFLIRALHNTRIYDRRGLDAISLYENNDLSWVENNYNIIKNIHNSFSSIPYYALSFTNEASELVELKNKINKSGIQANIMAKIETITAINNIEDIIEVADSIMIARGDLAVKAALNGLNIMELEDSIRRQCDKKDTECIVATRISDSIADGKTTMSNYEISKIKHEMSLNLPLNLLFANETNEKNSALKNYTLVMDTIKQLTYNI